MKGTLVIEFKALMPIDVSSVRQIEHARDVAEDVRDLIKEKGGDSIIAHVSFEGNGS